MIRTYGLLIVFLLPSNLFSQYHFNHFNHINNATQHYFLYTKDVDVHSSIKPLNGLVLDSLSNKEASSLGYSENWFTRKMFHEHLVNVNMDGFQMTLNPIVNLQLGSAQELDDYTYVNTRGFLMEGKIGKKFSFYSSYLENQGRFPNYVNSKIQNRNVLPGQGSKVRAFGEGGYDYGLASGEISYIPNEYFAFTAGQGRNFLGEGYRSMLLSDFAYNYPFFRVETSAWKFKYINLWAQLNDIRPEAQVGSSYNVYAKKYLSAHYLSVNINSRWNVSLFEAIIFGDTAQLRGLDPSFLNPVILYRPIEFSVGSQSGNALMGLASSYKFFDYSQVYGQFLLDEFSIEAIQAREGSWVNKFSWQLGIKTYHSFGIKGLFTRLEYNASRPYTYSHRNILTNYGHYGSELAHPWGANFNEFLAQFVYQKNRWEFELHIDYGLIGLDSSNTSFGSDIFRSYSDRQADLGNETGQGVKANLLFVQARCAWIVNPKTGLKLEAGLRYRSLQSDVFKGITTPLALGETSWFFAGLRTELFNRYYDF